MSKLAIILATDSHDHKISFINQTTGKIVTRRRIDFDSVVRDSSAGNDFFESIGADLAVEIPWRIELGKGKILYLKE